MPVISPFTNALGRPRENRSEPWSVRELARLILERTNIKAPEGMRKGIDRQQKVSGKGRLNGIERIPVPWRLLGLTERDVA